MEGPRRGTPPPHRGGAPTPPPGAPPPRPPGLQRDEQELSGAARNAHFQRQANKARSLSCDDILGRQQRDDGDAPRDAWKAPVGAAVQGHNIQVAVRCRPLHKSEGAQGGRAIIKVVGGKTVVLEDPQTVAADDYLRINKSKERQYTFDEAFTENTPTSDIHDRTARNLIGGVIQGFNATVFTYGATGAGKTHTMLGNFSEPGIMMLTLLDLFKEVENQREDRHFEVKCSFLEVYNENIRDLLRPDADYLDLREDPVKGMCVAGISEVGGLESAKEIMTLLHQGNRHRTTEATGANVTSSRSHAVLQVMVEQRDKTADIVANVNLGKLSMIDLAGSERASQTNNKGLRMIEGANINRSLLALGNCITALSSATGGAGFVPYRDSKMTRLLKDSLGGNCRTVMIANLSPCHLNYEDTHNTLKYANRAKNIKTKAVKNTVRVNYHVSKYTEIIKELQGELSDLKLKLGSQPENPLMDLTDRQGSGEAAEDEEDRHALHEQSAKWKQELMRNFEERVKIKRRLIDLANEAQNHMVEKSQAQVGISQWESAQAQGGHAAKLGTPPPIADLQERLETIKQEMVRTEETTKTLERQLLANQRQAEKLHAELPTRVQNTEMRNFLGLVSRIYVMEVENLDIQEMNDVTAPLLQQKDLEAEALRLQIEMRDRMIEEQTQLLDSEGYPLAERPEGWIEVSSMSVGKHFTQCPFRWHGDEDDVHGQLSPARRDQRGIGLGLLSRGHAPSGAQLPRQAGGRASSQPPTSREREADNKLPPLSPTRQGNYALRARAQPRALEGNLLPVAEGHLALAPGRQGGSSAPQYGDKSGGGASPANILAQACYRPTLGGAPHARRYRKKKSRRTDKELRDRAVRERQQQEKQQQHDPLQAETSRFSDGSLEKSDSEGENSPERSRVQLMERQGSVPRSTAGQRRGVLDKLNRRMKPIHHSGP